MNQFLSITSYGVLIGCIITPILVFGLYRNSGATTKKSFGIAIGVTLYGLLMFMFSSKWQYHSIIPGGALGISAVLAINLWIPTLVVWRFSSFFIGDGLSYRWLLLPHTLRLIGLFFLMEASNGQIGKVFALSAGAGDVMTAMIAITFLVILLSGGATTRFAYRLFIAFGVFDFILAFGLGALSAATPIQLFASGEVHRVTEFPIGMVPFFLVPIAMALHWLMVLNLRVQTDYSR